MPTPASTPRRPPTPQTRIACFVARAFVCSAMAGVALWTLPVFATETAMVHVREGLLRQTPSFLAAIVGAAPYGAEVQVLTRSEAWTKVTHAGGEGWLHETALASPKAARTSVLQPGDGSPAAPEPPSVTGAELALAGKGFSAAVEDTFRERFASLNYDAVERMEAFDVPSDRWRAFVADGGLALEDGA